MKQIFAILALLYSVVCCASDSFMQRHAISYEGGARFGDRVLLYAQARYLSYSTEIPFLYRPFPYSEYLSIDFQALSFDEHANKYNHQFRIHSADTFMEFLKRIRDPKTEPTLFMVDYFPANIAEWDIDFNRSILLDIPWYDPGFSSYLRNSLTPLISIPKFRREGYLNVAVHVRTLSGDDTPETSIKNHFQKSPTTAYHKKQVRRIYEWSLHRPMHVFLFSDTKEPEKFLKEFQEAFKDTDIVFSIQFNENPDLNNVIQDFFAMHDFDVLVATQSNFSMMSWRLRPTPFDMVLFPIHAADSYPNAWVDRVQFISKKSNWFPYEMNVVLKND